MPRNSRNNRNSRNRVKKAADLMHKRVESVTGSFSVGRALEKMRKKNISSLIVERRNANDAYGIITKKDIVTKVIDPGASRRNLKKTKVHEVMTKPLVTVSPGLAIKYCARLMKNTGVTRVPVFDGKKIVGILSQTDMFNKS